MCPFVSVSTFMCGVCRNILLPPPPLAITKELGSRGTLTIFPTLLQLDTKDTNRSITWPIAGLRRYVRTTVMCEVMIEAGRRCGPQQGTYVFICDEFSTIYDLIKRNANIIANPSSSRQRLDTSATTSDQYGYHHIISPSTGEYSEPLFREDRKEDKEGEYATVLTEPVYDVGDAYFDVTPNAAPLIVDCNGEDDEDEDEDEYVYDNSSYSTTDEPLYADALTFTFKNSLSLMTPSQSHNDDASNT
eukprot:m.55548 g.55548  ORF g.55548 m.55548 type:complete len:246 (+) comp11130_c1_seq11:26-763(+)